MSNTPPETDPDDTDDSPTVLRVEVSRLETDADVEARLDELEAAGDAISAGEEPAHPYRIGVESPEELHRVLSDTNLRVLEAIAAHDPESLRELGRVLDRDIRGVHDSIATLKEYGFVELRQDGRAKRPVVWYDELEISVPLSRRSTDADETEVSA